MSEQRIAIVTGASRGIGAAIAQQLGRQGCVVIGTATSEKGAHAITENLKAADITGQGMVLQVGDVNAIKETLKAIEEQYGMPSILVNNAGIVSDNLLMRMTDEMWESVIDTNLTGVFRMTRACVRGMMKKRWGRIITVGSVVGDAGNPGSANYCATKAGVKGFSKSVALELAARGITANVVAPGYIETDMTAALNDEQKSRILASVPAGRMGQPAEIAATVGFLATDVAGYITGQTIHVNGGMYMS